MHIQLIARHDIRDGNAAERAVRLQDVRMVRRESAERFNAVLRSGGGAPFKALSEQNKCKDQSGGIPVHFGYSRRIAAKNPKKGNKAVQNCGGGAQRDQRVRRRLHGDRVSESTHKDPARHGEYGKQHDDLDERVP